MVARLWDRGAERGVVIELHDSLCVNLDRQSQGPGSIPRGVQLSER